MSGWSFHPSHDGRDSCAWTALSILGLEHASPNVTKVKLMHAPKEGRASELLMVSTVVRLSGSSLFVSIMRSRTTRGDWEEMKVTKTMQGADKKAGAEQLQSPSQDTPARQIASVSNRATWQEWTHHTQGIFNIQDRRKYHMNLAKSLGPRGKINAPRKASPWRHG